MEESEKGMPPKKNNNQTGPNIFKALRLSQDIGVTELAKKMNVGRTYIHAIESGKKFPSITFIKKYSEYFEISYRTILLLEEDSRNNNYNFQKLLLELLKVQLNKDKRKEDKTYQ